jgi:acetyltransferase-like isoleucine patch superfamily enzyme
VAGWQNILAGVETCPGYMPGCYIQAIGKIYIGDYTQISANVGLISANHDLFDSREHVIDAIKIGRYCWIGMGAVILPGVTLGDHTVVGANAVVTKSFTDGYCVIAGNPAKLIKNLNRDRCVSYRSKNEYHGYIPKSKFEDFRNAKLTV